MPNLPQISIDTDLRDSLCFGCGQNNTIGLKLRFQWDGRTARTEFIPGKQYQGWLGVVHGGILTSMLDEAVSHAARFQGMNCLTAKMQIKFIRPALVDEPLIITASITRNTRRLIESKATISLPDGTQVAEGIAKQFVIETIPDNKGKKEPQSDVCR
jgi:uncharacterized protein (TIGR00369 family)